MVLCPSVPRHERESARTFRRVHSPKRLLRPSELSPANPAQLPHAPLLPMQKVRDKPASSVALCRAVYKF